MRFLLPFLFFCLMTLPVYAENLLFPPNGPVVAGTPFEVVLYVTNPGETEIAVEMPEKVPFTLSGGAEPLQGELHPAEAGNHLVVAPHSFATITLQGTMPENAKGVHTLQVDTLSAKTIVVASEAAPPPATGDAELCYPKEEAISAHISTNEPAYFIVGFRGNTTAKFQVSFKYRFFAPEGDFASRHPWIADFYMGYTQTSFWDLQSFSKPFKDTSYRPSVFFYKRKIASHGQITRIGLQTGFEHESNGKGGLDSRSINILFLKPVLELGDRTGYHWTISPKAWVYLDKSDNPDLQDYRGYGDLTVKYGAPEGVELSGTFRKGVRRGNGSIQGDLIIPFIRNQAGTPVSYFHVQYFNGYGETLLDYNRKVQDQFRFGFMIIR